MLSGFDNLIENIPAIFYRSKYDKHWTMLFLNDAIYDLTGYPKSDFIENSVRTFWSITHPEDVNYLSNSVDSALQKNMPWKIEYRMITKEGHVKWVSEIGLGITSDSDGMQYLEGFIMDISDRKKETQEQLERQARHDSLTELPNRYALTEFLTKEISRASRHNYFGAVLFLDLDNFKSINDVLGHEAGDAVLKIISEHLKQFVRQEDFVGRLGGDEFVLVLTELSDDLALASERAQAVAQGIINRLDEPVFLSDHQLNASSCIGITLFPGTQAKTTGELLKQADMAVYHAKNKGAGSFSFFSGEMQKQAEQRLHMARDIQEALEQKQLFLHYQPQLTIDNQVFGVEALARWNHPTRGLVGPDEFIPIAEEAGLINKLGAYVLHRALSEWSKLLTDGILDGAMKVAVNISPSHFLQTDFVDQIEQIVGCYEVPNHHLVLEITEEVVIQDINDISAKMKALQQLGIGISLDDFGTGYSSLAYIKTLPLDTLKIDRSFVRDIHTDPNDAAIVDGILAMTAALGVDVIAEGVETEAQRLFLMQRGCKFYQGYLFSRPELLNDLVKKGLFALPVKACL